MNNLQTFKLKYYIRKFDVYSLHEKEMKFRNIAEAYRYIYDLKAIPITVTK